MISGTTVYPHTDWSYRAYGLMIQQGNEPVSAMEACHRLERGNRRFYTGKACHPRQDVITFPDTCQDQHPFAIIFTCVDARVCPRLIFDQGVNDLNVICIAGHVLGNGVLASIEFLVKHLNIKLVVVLGHQSCGAVKAAVEGILAEDHVDKVTDALLPAVAIARSMQGNVIENAIKVQTRLTTHQLRTSKPTLAKYAETGGLQIVGAYYDVQTGVVEFNP
jgi:carbonic anhydrase